MPGKPVNRSPVFKRLDKIKASLRRGPREKKVLLHQLRELGKTDFRACHTYELENVKSFLKRFFWERTLHSVPGLKKTRLEVLNRVSMALVERGIFPEHTVVKVGDWRFDANTLRKKVEERLSKEARAHLVSGSPKADPLIASALKSILNESVERDFLKWKKTNPNSSFYLWLNARLVRKGRAQNRKE